MGIRNNTTLSELVRASSIQAEKAYVGSLLAHGASGELPTIKITEDDFYDQSIRTVFVAIKELVNEKVLPELMAVRDTLTKKGVFGKGVSNQTLVDLMESDFNYHNLSRYEYSMRDNKRRRDTEELVIQLQNDDVKDSATLLQMGQKLIALATSSGASNKGIAHEDVNALFEHIEENKGKKLFGWSFGKQFSFLDEATKGLRKGKTYRIGAPSNVGKSQMVYSIINSLVGQGAKVAFLTLENDKSTTLSFLLSNKMGIQNDRLMDGSVEGDWEYLTQIKDKLTILEDVYDINSIFSRIMEIQPDIVILDYIGLISAKGFTDESKYNEYATQVQRFVKASQVCWLDLSNLPNNLQLAEDIKSNPQFFGSTFLRNNTDVGIHITSNKEFYDLREKVLEKGIPKDIALYKYMSGVTITLSKNRLGPHSIIKKYIVDYSNGGAWREMEGDFIGKLSMAAL